MIASSLLCCTLQVCTSEFNMTWDVPARVPCTAWTVTQIGKQPFASAWNAPGKPPCTPPTPAWVAQVRLDSARARAESILEAQGAEGGGRSKAREINALYAKAHRGGGAAKSKPSRSSQRKAKGPRLDKRMLSDKRQVLLGGMLIWRHCCCVG